MIIIIVIIYLSGVCAVYVFVRIYAMYGCFISYPCGPWLAYCSISSIIIKLIAYTSIYNMKLNAQRTIQLIMRNGFDEVEIFWIVLLDNIEIKRKKKRE